jgi:SPP1 gp7 family putative phage head morphogenesis protein
MPLTLEQYEHDLQKYLEQLKTVEYTQFNAVLQKINKLIGSSFSSASELTDMRRAALDKFVRTLTLSQKKMMDTAVRDYMLRLKDFSGYSYNLEASLLHVATGAKTALGGARAAWKTATTRELGASGELLEQSFKDLSSSQALAMSRLLRKGAVNGLKNSEILREIRDPKAGMLARFGRQNATIMRTAMQHVSNSARQTVWEENSDIVTGYQWVSVLDDKTSDICEELDGEVFEVGEGPLPPAHYNCRSTTVAVLDKRFDALDKGATRSSDEGYVPLDTTFDQWMQDND